MPEMVISLALDWQLDQLLAKPSLEYLSKLNVTMLVIDQTLCYATLPIHLFIRWKAQSTEVERPLIGLVF